MVKKIILFLAVFVIFSPVASARTFVTDWYLKDFQSEIVVNKDSSLLITEKIIADCDNLLDKHGIFRILPTQIKTTEGTIKTPIELISITDFIGNPVKYSTIRKSKTITWKIGDPDITVSGENYYLIKYRVKNAIRFNGAGFDELYWNLLGTFWDIEIDSFVAAIIFPEEVTEQNSQVDYYTGYLGEKNKNLAEYQWIDRNVLQINSIATLMVQQGITASITFPKNIFTPYKPSFSEKYGAYLWFLLPLIVFLVCFLLWNKYGKDPHLHKTVIPEFEIPENLLPMQMGMLVSNGRFNTKFISATIIDLATRGFVSIEQTEEKVIVFSKKDFRLKRLHPQNVLLSTIENSILNMIFEGKEEIYLSDLKKEFYKNIPEIRKAAKDDLTKMGLITKKGLVFQAIFFAIAIIIFAVPLFLHLVFLVLWISAGIFLVFSFIMPKRTEKGAELNWRIKGFKLYMKTAEQYRQQFFEKENTMPTLPTGQADGRQVFEKLLPYAMIFNMTKEWVKKMEQIYGADYFQAHIPIWYVGLNAGGFDIDSFASEINSLATSISSNVGGPSGAGGAGGAGGGGGGGGGGGW